MGHKRGELLIMKEINFGIIGCGLISKSHAEAVLGTPGARLAGATDPNGQARLDFTRKYGIHAFDSVEELLASKDVDVVCICTPSGLHAPLAVKAAEAGKHIVVEKPMAINLKEADDIIGACEANGVKLSVISQLRFSPAVIKLKEAVDQGLLGRLVMGDVVMKFYRSREYYANSGWRGTWKMDGGGALMNQGIHGVDVLQYIMGPLKSVYANTRTLAREIEVEDTAAAVVEFKSGALGVIQGTTSIFPGSPRRLEINGDKGTIALEEDSIIQWDIEGRELPEDVILKHTENKSSSNPADIEASGHLRQIGDMADAIRSGRKPLIDQYEGRKPIEIIMAIYESSRTGRPVML